MSRGSVTTPKGEAVPSRWCEGGHVSFAQPKTLGRKADCPSCGRSISFHAITGRFKPHRPALSPPKELQP